MMEEENVHSDYTRERIEKLFRSGLEEDTKIARLLCHAILLDYYVATPLGFKYGPGYRPTFRGIRMKSVKYCIYSLDKKWLEENYKGKVYQIKLEKWSS